MNGRTAKRLRREAYGDLSLRNIRTYMIDRTGCTRLHPDEPRATYQALKHGKDVKGTGTEERYELPYLSEKEERSIRRRIKDVFASLFGERKTLNAHQQGALTRLQSVFRPKRIDNYRRAQAR